MKKRQPSRMLKKDCTTSPASATKDNNNGRATVVTPIERVQKKNDRLKSKQARRTLFNSISKASLVVTPSPRQQLETLNHKRKSTELSDPPAKRRLIFGKLFELKECAPNVNRVYKIVRRLTGSIGGNGYCGPIYGELTMGSMQKMIDLMIEHTSLDETSKFIDVGSGIGKPNLHVAQYPGVAFSCGVEMEHTRWSLGMVCLKAVLDQAVSESERSLSPKIQGKCVFLHKNVTEAKTFDPFTHVYMFSIGFPPPLWLALAKMWNTSTESEYLICYHPPRAIIEKYKFKVELLAQIQTSMHGSKEGHTGYIYRRSWCNTTTSPTKRIKCDKLFQPGWNLVQEGLSALQKDVAQQVEETMGSGRRTRKSSRQQGKLTRC